MSTEIATKPHLRARRAPDRSPTSLEDGAEDSSPALENRAESLTEKERRRYRSLKEKLQKGKARRAAILYEVRSRELFREEYDTFEDFCSEETILSKRAVDLHARWGKMRKLLSPPPERESHARELPASVSQEELDEIWEEVQRRANGRPAGVTAPLIAEVVSDYSGDSSEDEGKDGEKDNDLECHDDGTDAERPKGRRDDSSASSSDADSSDAGSSDDDSGDADSGDADTSEAGEESSGGEDSSGLEKMPDGAFVKANDEALEATGLNDEAAVKEDFLSFEDLDSQAFDQVLDAAEAPGRSLAKSSAEDGIADSIWRPVVGSRIDFSGGLPVEDEKAETAILRPTELGRLSSPRVEARAEQVLVCPGLDLFGPAVPDRFVEEVLEGMENIEVAPVIFTRHLSRAASFSIPEGVWLGTDATRESLSGRAESLSEVQAPEVRWVLYDVQKEDREDGLPDLPSPIDWVVFDPPGGAGVSLSIGELRTLICAVEDAGKEWSFRRPLKTFGQRLPA